MRWTAQISGIFISFSLSLDFITFYNLRIYSMTKMTWMGRGKLELKQIQFILCVSRRVENSLLSFAFPLSRLSAHYVPSNLICVRCESEIFARHLVIIPSSWFHQLEEFELFRLFEHESIWNSLIEPSTNKSRRKKKAEVVREQKRKLISSMVGERRKSDVMILKKWKWSERKESKIRENEDFFFLLYE